ncbi:tubulin binding cofactor A protein [Cardiosporidium cionae]|uniref:Tubulin-specific chaperone A n=1 Tax=Cardiosporidium cionae TaxID=476202 RepID=A0ABQ7JA98_9APIC|nr:tubulin binding cofactor A protein [Cardiosporidium cionae]|eukprot:KAF8820863.1 tubulin binding cofactor A protein [Cardiosporidium cionae]
MRVMQVKHKALQRLLKDLATYQKETLDFVAIIQRQKGEGADPSEIKRTEGLRCESLLMVTDIEKRLRSMYEGLNGLLLNSYSNEIIQLRSAPAKDGTPMKSTGIDALEPPALSGTATTSDEQVSELMKEILSIQTTYNTIYSCIPDLQQIPNAFSQPTATTLSNEEIEEEI